MLPSVSGKSIQCTGRHGRIGTVMEYMPIWRKGRPLRREELVESFRQKSLMLKNLGNISVQKERMYAESKCESLKDSW